MVFTFRRKSQRKIVLDESFSRSSTSSSRSSSFDQQISPIHPDAISTKHTNVLLVGQIYMDTIMTVEYYPQEDSKIQSGHTHQRRGGNCLNTAEVLSQFSKVNVSVMSAIGSKESSRLDPFSLNILNCLAYFDVFYFSALISQLEARNIKTSTCVHRKAPTPSCYIIQCKDTGSRTIISCNK
jgi:ketohexokinase